MSYTNQPAAPPGDSVNVLLLDSLNTDREDQAYVHQQILNYLKTMDPSTRIAIFTLSSKLRMVQGFSTDSSALQAALNDPKSGAPTTTTTMSRSLQDKLADQNEVATLSAEQMSGIGLEALQASQANYASYQADQRVSMTLEAMNYIARYLAGVPVAKNLIWFSGSFPISVSPTGKDKQQTDAMRQYGPAIRKTADLLTLSKVAVYPVGAEGIVTDHSIEASNDGPNQYRGRDPRQPDGRQHLATSGRQDGSLRRRTRCPRRQDNAQWSNSPRTPAAKQSSMPTISIRPSPTCSEWLPLLHSGLHTHQQRHGWQVSPHRGQAEWRQVQTLLPPRLLRRPADAKDPREP